MAPAKRIRWLSVFVSKECYVVDPNWLDNWLVRDYLVPSPSEDLDGVKQVMAEYTDMAAISRKVLGQLKELVSSEGQWVEGPEDLLTQAATFFWTEHSERNFVNGMAACLRIPKEQRDYLGRWMPEQSDDYLRTARAVIGEIQTRVAKAIRDGDDRLDESESSNSLAEFLEA